MPPVRAPIFFGTLFSRYVKNLKKNTAGGGPSFPPVDASGRDGRPLEKVEIVNFLIFFRDWDLWARIRTGFPKKSFKINRKRSQTADSKASILLSVYSPGSVERSERWWQNGALKWRKITQKSCAFTHFGAPKWRKITQKSCAFTHFGAPKWRKITQKSCAF